MEHQSCEFVKQLDFTPNQMAFDSASIRKTNKILLTMIKRNRMGMVGGGRGAFIGGVHRRAANRRKY